MFFACIRFNVSRIILFFLCKQVKMRHWEPTHHIEISDQQYHLIGHKTVTENKRMKPTWKQSWKDWQRISYTVGWTSHVSFFSFLNCCLLLAPPVMYARIHFNNWNKWTIMLSLEQRWITSITLKGFHHHNTNTYDNSGMTTLPPARYMFFPLILCAQSVW